MNSLPHVFIGAGTHFSMPCCKWQGILGWFFFLFPSFINSYVQNRAYSPRRVHLES